LSKNILLCISDTGGGHRSAANAIGNAITERQSQIVSNETYKVVITDVVGDSNGMHRLFVAIYNFLLRHKQSWMKYYYRLIECFKPNDSIVGYWLAAPYLRRLFQTVDPVLIVSLHPMANHYLARALASWKAIDAPELIVVITDPNANLWTGWACSDASLIISPNRLATDKLISLAISPERIRTIGMPVDPEYLRPPARDREQFLSALGLDAAMLTVCLSAGWAGGGNMMKIYRAMAAIQKPFQAIVICGNNIALYRRFQKLSGGMPFRTAVISELATLSDVMNASDLLVTKAGGLTTYEAVARRLPMAIDMLTVPMPQECGTAEALIEVGLAQAVLKPEDIVTIIARLERDDERFSRPLPVKYNLDHTSAVYEIAELILKRASREESVL
jgi:UDP-N-acetylglucosamine:LPS N-acetylglucosamine transferase